MEVVVTGQNEDVGMVSVMCATLWADLWEDGCPKLPTLWRLYGITPTVNHPSPKRQMPDMTNSEHVLGTFIRKMCRTVARSQVWTLIQIACGYVTNRMDLPRFQRP